MIVYAALFSAKAEELSYEDMWKGMSYNEALEEVKTVIYNTYEYKRFKLRRALGYAPTVVKYSREYKVDHLLISQIITTESSWNKNAVGAIGEKGLMQLKGAFARGLNLDLVDDQIKGGAIALEYCYKRCGETLNAINCYGTKKGKCKPILNFAKRKYRGYKKTLAEIRGGMPTERIHNEQL
jgi:hypothetical protein